MLNLSDFNKIVLASNTFSEAILFWYTTNELREFISEINHLNEMQIEEVYTGKALYALKNYLEKNAVKNKKVLFIHTGGIFTEKN